MYLIVLIQGRGLISLPPLLHGNMFAFTTPPPLNPSTSTTTTPHPLLENDATSLLILLIYIRLIMRRLQLISTEHVYMWSLHGKLHLFSSISDYTNFYINMFYTYVPNTTCKTDYF